MKTHDALRTFGWLARDTFRQSLATRLFWILLSVSALCTLVCASAGVSGDAPLA